MSLAALAQLPKVTVVDCTQPFDLTVLGDKDKPLILRGLCAGWPLVQAGLQSVDAAAALLQQYASAELLNACYLPASEQGRVFYNEQLTGFNFQSMRQDLTTVLSQLRSYASQPEAAPTLYVGSSEVTKFFPGLLAEHGLAIAEGSPLTSVWLGNCSRIAAHFDFPHNLACVLVGKRRFTLFPPEQIANLYPGPMEFAPGGQDISLVDFANPDYARFPRFKDALAKAQVADLEPVDVLFIPSMWWHHVEALSSFNLLLTHWWRDTPAFLGRPTNALLHSVLSLRSLPKAQRQAWQAIFDYYIFNHDEHSQQLPPQAEGLLQHPLPEQTARQLRADLTNKLKR